MALIPGLGGGVSRPVPVDPGLSGSRPYVPPVSSGEPSPTFPPQMGLRPGNTQYSSASRVVQAYRDNVISYNQAYQILISQFGFSSNDATDALGSEMEVILNPVIPVPDDSKPDQPVSEPDIEAAVPPAAAVSELPAIQDFQVVGLLAILAAVWVFRQQG